LPAPDNGGFYALFCTGDLKYDEANDRIVFFGGVGMMWGYMDSFWVLASEENASSASS
jgi:hypothetical protein